jgi:Dyp-type peroxidase family
MAAYNPLDLADIQGNVLRGYAFPFLGCLLVGIHDAEQGRRWLDEMLPRVTTAEEWSGAKPADTLNVAFTCPGLRALGVPEELCATFSEAFREGMAARAVQLRDTGPDAPSNWDTGLGRGDGHALVMVYAQREEVLHEQMAALRDRVEEAGGALSVVFERLAALLPFGREHFGFSDGFSQPAVRYSGSRSPRGQGTPGRHAGWREVAVGEFILGYEDEDQMLPDAPAPPLGANGTYLILRVVYQDVALFRRVVREAARHYPGGEELLAAKIVGRWQDGTPLEVSPDRPDPAVSGDKERSNDFRYADDRDGLRCPVGAHIRRANPRDALGWGGARSKRHRLIRRAMPYGPPLAEGRLEPDGVDRGLLFLAYNASIERQFEIVQGQWLRDGDIFGLGDDVDFLLGSPGPGKMTIEGHPPFFLSPQQPLVTTKGGEYLFLPGVSALRALAGDLSDWM